MLIKLEFKLNSQSINATIIIKELIYLCKHYESFFFHCALRRVISVSKLFSYFVLLSIFLSKLYKKL